MIFQNLLNKEQKQETAKFVGTIGCQVFLDKDVSSRYS